jgi:hypothetical protein
MSFEDEFPIGCEVLCTQHSIHKGAIGTVIGYGLDTLKVVFSPDQHPDWGRATNLQNGLDKKYFNLFPRRFVRTDGVRITPVIRKIRQMEQRRRAA